MIPAGVNVTCFMDCCHSGTINRVVGGTPHPGSAGGRRARYLVPTSEMQEAHAEFRRRTGSRAPAGTRTPAAMREVSFSACQAREVAWENEGQGDFTRRAAKLLADSPAQRWTNAQFYERVVEAFGPARVQTPELNCADALRGAWLLEP